LSDPVNSLKAALDGRYRIERPLAEGGMATVFLAHDVKHGRQVAIKVLKPELSATVGKDRFIREIEIVATLSHPHILMLIDSGAADDLLYYVMPYIDGGSIRDRLDREATLPMAHTIRIADQVASALAYAHERGIIHRDIKPENILLSGDRAVVADFGIARAVERAAGTHLTETGLAIGTSAYMSPEQAFGESALDGRSDVYSLGCVVYEMLAGTPPFTARTPQALMAKRLTGRPRGLRALRSDVPLYVERAVERALASEKSARFRSSRDFANTLTSGTVVERTGRARLAVLPPVNVTGDAEADHLALGLHEALISKLGQSDVAVLGRSSVLPYAGSDKPLQEIARELDVHALVESSLHRLGDTLLVQARLVGADHDEGLWSASLEGDAADALSLYRELSAAAAAAIEPALGLSRAPTVTSGSRIGSAAYEKYMRGRMHQERFTPEDFRQALRYYEAALALEPEYAPAHAGIALVWGSQIVLGMVRPLEGGPRWKAAALQAVNLDPNLSEAHQALAQAYTWFDWDWSLAEAAFRRSIELDPNDPQTRTFYSHFLNIVKRHGEAMIQIERALDLDPHNPFHQTMFGAALLQCGRFAQAEAELHTALEMAPDNALAHWGLALCHFNQGEDADALGSAKSFYTSVGDAPVVEALDSGGAQGGFAGGAARAADILVARSQETYVKPEMISFAFDWAGDVDRALQWIERGYELRDHQIAYLAVAPYSDPVRTSSRYRELLRRLSLPG
jgi:TolB-like protein/tRNA A-37 threonylcarbamoyl transferase component Bud32/cytochrome c-type biogenesis protein CcmH/NrfG